MDIAKYMNYSLNKGLMQNNYQLLVPKAGFFLTDRSSKHWLVNSWESVIAFFCKIKKIHKGNMCLICPVGWRWVLLDTELRAGAALETVPHRPLTEAECEMKLLVKMDGFCIVHDGAL